MTSDNLNWAPDVFASCYDALRFQQPVPSAVWHQLRPDIAALLIVPGKNEKSRAVLAQAENGTPVTLGGEEYVLNQPFVAVAAALAAEMDVDEVCAAQLLQFAGQSAFAKGADLMSAGRLAFLRRYTYLANILGYLVLEKRLDLVLQNPKEVLAHILASFVHIYKLMRLQNDSIDKQKVTADINDLLFVSRVVYVRDQLFAIHGILAQVLFSLLENYPEAMCWDSYAAITTHINDNISDDADTLILHFLPALMKLTTGLLNLSDDQVHKFHLTFVSSLASDYAKATTGETVDISKSSIRTYTLPLQLMFFVALIPWCKASDARTRKYDFEKDILRNIEILIGYGTLEQILCYTAESAKQETKIVYEESNLFDFRPLLQRSFPRLRPSLFMYSGNEELLHAYKLNPGMANILTLCDYLALQVTAEFSDELLAPFFHEFFSTFTNHAAIVLTLLRDNEEDFLLSSSNKKQLGLEGASSSGDNDNSFDNSSIAMKNAKKTHLELSMTEVGVDLDEIASRAELERFYLAGVYTYSNRPELCDKFWNTDDTNVLGFIGWGLANNTSPLITAAFCLLLGSLTYTSQGGGAKVWDILINSLSGNLKKNDYSKISIDSIVSSLTYYADSLIENLEADLSSQVKRQQKKQEYLFSGSYNSKQESADSESFSIQLSEDSVVFIAGFFMLISAIAKNSDSGSAVSQSLLEASFNRFNPVILAFLKFDNLITSASATQTDSSVAPVLFNDENRTVIINLILNLLGDYAEADRQFTIRNKIWTTLDAWICHSFTDTESNNTTPSETTRYAGVSLSLVSSSSVKTELSRLRKAHRGVSIKQGFQMALTDLSSVSNFARLVERLLRPLSLRENEFLPITLLYPCDLGSSYRHNNQIGIWPYIEYLLVEILGQTVLLKNDNAKTNIMLSIMTLIKNSLCEIDWTLYDDVAPKVFRELSKIKDSFAVGYLQSGESTVLSYNDFIHCHHSLAVLNYLFDERCNRVIFDILSTGTEKAEKSQKYERLVLLSLDTINQILNLQKTFINSLLPIIKSSHLDDSQQGSTMGYGTSLSLILTVPKSSLDNIYYPNNVGTKGVTDFYEILLFHVSSSAQIALYVGYSEYEVANLALEILSKILNSPLFMARGKLSDDVLLHHNRLLSIFESIDETTSIKYSFVQQMESITDALGLKFKILKFILANLPTSRDITVGHFLLGYNIKARRLELDTSGQEIVLLQSLVSLLLSTLNLISEVDYNHGYHHIVDLGPVKLVSLIMETVIRLCRNPISSAITLKFLRQFNLFEELLNKQPKIDETTVWDKNRFNGDVQDGVRNDFISHDSSCDAFFHFVNYRNCALQYLSLEFHDIRSTTTKDKYVELLLDSSEALNGTPKVLNFLDVLNFQFYNFEDYKFVQLQEKYDLNILLQELRESKEREEIDESVISRLTKFKCSLAMLSMPLEDSRLRFFSEEMDEAMNVQCFLKKFLSVVELKSLHSKSLHSWVQIIQVVTNDGVSRKTDFILRVLQIILPKINNDYYERDISFAEELISLCVFLFELYEEETKTEEKLRETQRLLPLFKTCVNGLLCSNSTTRLRSDLYLLLNKFVQRSIKSETMLVQILHLLRSVDRKFIEVVCNDCIYSEGVSRITSMVFMESLVHLSVIEKSTSIVDTLVNNNSISLYVRFLRRADEIISACGETNEKPASGISIETFLYELTALKATLYLLIRIGQTRYGASQLIQNELFSVIKHLKFLSVDPDLGLDFRIESANRDNSENAQIKLALDVPLALRDRNPRTDDHVRTVSFYEILVPTFQLVATVLLSMGPSYMPGVSQVKEILVEFRHLVVGVLKREELLKTTKLSAYEDETSISYTGLELLVKLFTLVDCVVNSDKETEEVV